MFIIDILEFIVKNPIQNERMKKYFLDAAKNIIRSEGFRSMSARTVAETAGYSYATIYNYFDDLKDLIFSCAEDFLNDCTEFMQNAPNPGRTTQDNLVALAKAYCNFFVQYTGVFELIYLETMSFVANQEKISTMTAGFLNEQLKEYWEQLGLELNLKQDDLDFVADTFNSTVHSKLIFYINRRVPTDYKVFIDDLTLRLNQVIEMANKLS